MVSLGDTSEPACVPPAALFLELAELKLVPDHDHALAAK
jgi:hypothetical protein